MKEIDELGAMALLSDPELDWKRTTGLFDDKKSDVFARITGIGDYSIGCNKYMNLRTDDKKVIIYETWFKNTKKWFIREW